MIYLDSCALVKLIRTEDGSSALQEWLDERCAEVLRTIRRNNHRETRGNNLDLAEPLRNRAALLRFVIG